MTRRVAAVTLILLAPLWRPAPGGADVEGAVCETDWVATLTVPMSTIQSVGRYTSGGETGVIRCDGSIRGRPVTGEGTYGEDGAYGPGPQGGADCSKGAGSGDFTATIPTEDGPQHISGPLTFYYMGPAGVLTGGVAGTFQLSYPSGDCLTAPAPKVRIQARGLVVTGGG
ncbi:MAG: hypothetical protein ACRD0O_08445 [Acidimicrobiia bacterium]